MAPGSLTSWKTPRKRFWLSAQENITRTFIGKTWGRSLWESTDIHVTELFIQLLKQRMNWRLQDCLLLATADKAQTTDKAGLSSLPRYLRPPDTLPPGHCWRWLTLTWELQILQDVELTTREQRVLQDVELTAVACRLQHGQTWVSSWKPLEKTSTWGTELHFQEFLQQAVL